MNLFFLSLRHYTPDDLEVKGTVAEVVEDNFMAAVVLGMVIVGGFLGVKFMAGQAVQACSP